MPRGGKRPGAGRPFGSKEAQTIAKEQAREALRILVLKHLRPLVEAQIANALGLKYLVMRDRKSGKFVRITEAMVPVVAGEETDIIEVWEKEPSVSAFADLMNRALDKPAEQRQEIQVTGSLDLITERLHAARARRLARTHCAADSPLDPLPSSRTP